MHSLEFWWYTGPGLILTPGISITWIATHVAHPLDYLLCVAAAAGAGAWVLWRALRKGSPRLTYGSNRQ